MANIPSTILVPGVYVTLDNSLANTALGGSFKTVIIGQKIAAGTATAETLVQVFSDADAKEKFGVGSVLANMFSNWFANNAFNEVYAIALADAGGAVANQTDATITGTATASGSIALYINGTRYQYAVATGDTNAAIATGIAALVNLDVDISVIAVGNAGVAEFTGKNGGLLSDQVDIRVNQNEGEALPAGITIDIAESQAGATDPDITDAIAALPDELFNLLVNPYTDATSLTALTTELDRRWGNTVQIDGHAIQAFKGTSSTVATKGDTLNSEHLTMMDAGKLTMEPEYFWAAVTGGQMAGSASVDPARPFRSLEMAGVTGDDPTDRRSFTESNTILLSGTSTHLVGNDGTARIERLVTTYKTNGVGAEDTSYQNTNTMFNLSFLRQSFITRMLSRFPRHKLAEDGTVFGSGQAIATPAVVKGEIIQLYREWITLGLVQDLDTFSDSLSVEIDSVNRSRVNVTMQPELVGQFYQIDNTLQFIV
jgi:phage tail sheath gpL-like